MTMEALPQDLADFLVTKNFDPEYFNKKGDPSEAGEATTIKFDYVAGTGKNYGTAVCVVADNELSLYYGDNLGRGMEPEDKDEWYSFLEQLSNQAASHSATWSPTEINKLKHNLAGIAAIKEGLFEGYYGTKKISYMGEQTQARLVIKHNRVLGEDDKRYRYVESLFIETAEQERFRLPFKSLSAGRAMLEHVRSGGNPYDVRGNHITEIVGEMAVLSRFNRAQHHRVFEGVTQELVESARQYYRNLQETVRHLGSPRGYQAYFESWAPDQTGEAEALVENLRDMFVEQTLDARIEAALPTLAKIQQQGNNMKEAQIFENWVNNLSEGTWALPETPEQMKKLNQMMSAELIVGPDATNATEQLYDIVGDKELFEILEVLADQSEGRANIWEDSEVQRRLAELGIQTPQSTQAEPADVGQDEAPPVAEGNFVGPYDNPPQFQPGDSQAYRDAYAQGRSISIQNRADAAEKTLAQRAAEPRTFGQKIARDIGDPLKQLAKGNVKSALFDPPASLTNKGGNYTSKMTGGGGMGGSGFGGKRPGQSPSLDYPIQNENNELATMLRHAGVPLNEDANWKDIDDRSAPVKGANQKIKTIEPGSAIRVDPNYKNPGIAPSPKSNGMGRIVQGTWQADPKGTVKAPSGDPESVRETRQVNELDAATIQSAAGQRDTQTSSQMSPAAQRRDPMVGLTNRINMNTRLPEDDADPFNDPFFNSKSKPEAETFTQLQQQNAQGKGTSLKDMNPIDRDQYLKNTGNRTWDEKTQRSVPAVKTNEDEEFNRMLTLAGMHIKEANETVPSINQTNANIRGKIAPPNQIAAPTAASIIGNSPQVQASQTTPVANPGKPEAGVAFNQAKPPPAPTAASIIGNSPQVQASKSLPTTTAVAPAAAPAAPNYKADVAFGKGSPAATTATAAAPTTAPAAPDYKADVAFGKGSPAATTATAAAPTTAPAAPDYKADVAFNQNKSAVAEETDKDFAYILKHAGVPIKEGVLTDSTGSTLDHIIDTYKRDVKDFEQTGEMSRHLEQVLYDYYYDDMPYGAKTGEDIDTSEWISDRFADDLGINENLISPMSMPVSEGSCNMTAEGSYCPEHGLAECGSMYEDGRPGLPPKLNPRGKSQAQIDDRMTSVGFIPGTRDHAAAGEMTRAANPNISRPVSKPLPRSDIQGTDVGQLPLSPLGIGQLNQHPSVKSVNLTPQRDEFSPESDIEIEEGVYDPINSNSAMTGSYYEGKETKTQEGDALLARIKSLALLR